MISKYRLTNLFVNYLTEPEDTRKFRRSLERLGFVKLDVHTYFRPTAPDYVEGIVRAVKQITPRAATVKVMRITDKQWTDAVTLIGKD